LTDDIGIGCLSEARGESYDGFITDRYFNSFDTLGSQMFEQMFGTEIVLQHNSQRSSPKYQTTLKGFHHKIVKSNINILQSIQIEKMCMNILNSISLLMNLLWKRFQVT